MPTTLIEPAALAARLADPDWPSSTAVSSSRFLSGARFAWAAGHIPNALYAHLDHDLSGPRTALTGRHPLPAIAALSATFGRWGIDKEVQVVAYDQGVAAYAARLWWLLRWLGHPQVAVLDGGIGSWSVPGCRSTRPPRCARRGTSRPPRPRIWW